MTSRLPLATVRIGIALGMTITLLMLTACSDSQEDPQIDGGIVSNMVKPSSIEIDAPGEIMAGQPISVTVSVFDSSNNMEIVLILEGSFGAVPQISDSSQGEAIFSLGSNWTQYAGALKLTARAGGVETTRTVNVIPGPAADPILPLVGPRSIVADGEHWTMVVAVPMDEFGNAVAEGTQTAIHVQHPVAPGQLPESAQEHIAAETRHQLTWARIYSGHTAGQTSISVTADDAHSPERSIREMPGPPVAVDISANPAILAADGRQLVFLSTGQIKDQFDNILLEGTSVNFLATEPNGSRRIIPATIVDGRAYATLQSSSEPGTMTVKSWIAGVESGNVNITFEEGPAISAFSVAINIAEDELFLSAGPLVAALNQLVPDGTDVTFTLTGPNGFSAEHVAQTDFGYVVTPIRRAGLPSGQYRLEASAGSGSGEIGFFLP
jgi:hypothetical protein